MDIPRPCNHHYLCKYLIHNFSYISKLTKQGSLEIIFEMIIPNLKPRCCWGILTTFHQVLRAFPNYGQNFVYLFKKLVRQLFIVEFSKAANYGTLKLSFCFYFHVQCMKVGEYAFLFPTKCHWRRDMPHTRQDTSSHALTHTSYRQSL